MTALTDRDDPQPILTLTTLAADYQLVAVAEQWRAMDETSAALEHHDRVGGIASPDAFIAPAGGCRRDTDVSTVAGDHAALRYWNQAMGPAIAGVEDATEQYENGTASLRRVELAANHLEYVHQQQAKAIERVERHLLQQPAKPVPQQPAPRRAGYVTWRPRSRERRSSSRRRASTSARDPADPEPSAHRAEITAGDRCMFCEVAGRMVTLAEVDGFRVVQCTVCWCQT